MERRNYRAASLGAWHPRQGAGQQLALGTSLLSRSQQHLQCEPLNPRSLLEGRVLSQPLASPTGVPGSALVLPPTPPGPTTAAPEPGWTCSHRTLQPRAQFAVPTLPAASRERAWLEGLPRVSLGVLGRSEVGETTVFWPERVASGEMLFLPLRALSQRK